MKTTLMRRGAIAVASGAMALGALSLPAHATDAPVPLAEAGTATGWGRSTGGDAAVIPDAYKNLAFTQVSGGLDSTVALTAAGKVVAWGPFSSDIETSKPAGIDGNVAQLSAASYRAVAVKKDGTVAMWPTTSNGLTNTSGLSNIASASANLQFGVALRKDGSVTTWGIPSENTYGEQTVPAALQQPGAAKQVAVANNAAFALTTDGRVVAWGRNDLGRTTVPAELQQPGAVTKIASGGRNGIALTSAGKVVTWGTGTQVGTGFSTRQERDAPSALDDKTVVDIAGGESVYNWNLALTSDGEVVGWGEQPESRPFASAPASLQGKSVSAIATSGDAAFAITTSLTEVSKPTVTGTAKVGQTLQGTPAVFSGGGTVTNQWYAGLEPIEGATGTSLALTSAQVGKTISLRSTSTKGEETASSDSVATGAVADVVRTSTVKATATSGRYGSTAPKVSVTLTPSDATGTVQVYSGATKIGTGTASAGKATVTWSSKTVLTAGSKTLTVKYLGNATTAASQNTVKVTVAKASASVTAKSATSSIKVKKTKAKIAVTVKATGTTPTGTAAVYLGKTKVGSATLKSGKATVTLKVFAKKGKQTLSVRYLGSTNVGAATRSLSVTVK